MSKSLKFFLWSAVFVALLLACDQLLLRVPMRQPALAAVRSFYLDFRQRLIGFGETPPASIDQVIDRAAQAPTPAAPPPSLPPAAPAAARPAGVPQAAAGAEPRYLWVDADGTLQFAERLEEIPARYRKEARPLNP